MKTSKKILFYAIDNTGIDIKVIKRFSIFCKLDLEMKLFKISTKSAMCIFQKYNYIRNLQFNNIINNIIKKLKNVLNLYN